MKKINTHIIFISVIFVLSLFFLKSVLHRGVILNNIHYINDLTFSQVSAFLKENKDIIQDEFSDESVTGSCLSTC